MPPLYLAEFAMKVFKSILLILALVLVSLLVWGVNDFHDWKALGPGGLPHTLEGWVTVTGYRLAAQDPLATTSFSSRLAGASDVATLTNLKPRSGPRPQIARHPVPHRQLDQHATEFSKATLLQAYRRLVERDPAGLVLRTSAFEKHNDAIWLLPDIGREIAHVHPSDGTIHVVLSPSDAQHVLAQRWGELHPLVGMGNLSRTYTLIYAPRTETEVRTALSIITAAIAYARHTGGRNE